MKIKYWLMISYFVVMVLPLIALYLVYASINHFHGQREVGEYLEMSSAFAILENQLQDPSLYEFQQQENYDPIRELTDDTLSIQLYRHDGVRLFSSLETASSTSLFIENANNLYRNLNDIQQNHRTFSLKKPVLDNNELIGFFEITQGREDWVSGVNQRTLFYILGFSAFFLLTYAVMLFLLNRKLSHPLSNLQARMLDFASGKYDESELRKKQTKKKDEISELIIHYEQMRAQILENQENLTRQQKEKEFIVASLSHDLKTPLTIIRTYSEALQNDKHLTNEERKEYQEILQKKMNHMKHILDDLTMYTALQSSQLPAAFVEVDGEEFFEMVLSGFDEPCEKQDIHLVTELNVEGVLQVEPQYMMRLVDNLMSNAIRHTEPEQQIWLGAVSHNKPLPEWVFSSCKETIDSWRQNGTVVLVQNEGIAVSINEIESLFEPFVQGEQTRTSGGGSGLGLSIAKILVEKHDGKINMWSKKGAGTITAFWLKERGEKV